MISFDEKIFFAIRVIFKPESELQKPEISLSFSVISDFVFFLAEKHN
jgi:hypothetical protein